MEMEARCRIFCAAVSWIGWQENIAYWCLTVRDLGTPADPRTLTGHQRNRPRCSLMPSQSLAFQNLSWLDIPGGLWLPLLWLKTPASHVADCFWLRAIICQRLAW